MEITLGAVDVGELGPLALKGGEGLHYVGVDTGRSGDVADLFVEKRLDKVARLLQGLARS